jgi:hypothetical protein
MGDIINIHPTPDAFRQTQIAVARDALRDISPRELPAGLAKKIAVARRALEATYDQQPPLPEDIGERVQHLCEQHLAACEEALADPDGVDSPAYGPYDGCETCMIREILSVAWDALCAEFSAHDPA